MPAPCSIARAKAFCQRAKVAKVPPVRPAALSPEQERGRYLVSHVALCSDCHSPRLADGSFDPERWLSGVECFVDVLPDDPERGCLNTRNLTQHETGLANRSDREIKDMFLKGERPDGVAYRAGDPDLLLWILACLVDSALLVYQRYGGGIEAGEPGRGPLPRRPRRPSSRAGRPWFRPRTRPS